MPDSGLPDPLVEAADGDRFVLDETRGAVVAGPFEDLGSASEAAEKHGPRTVTMTVRVLELLHHAGTSDLTWELAGQRTVTDGGEALPQPWPRSYDAVTHGVSVRPDCLAVTGKGDPCTNGATTGPEDGAAICGMHDRSTDPELLTDAHQWVRIEDGDRVVVVCPNCEAVWEGGPPALRVACPTCDAAPGERCAKPDTHYSGEIPPHPERRTVVEDRVAELEACPESPLGGEKGDRELRADGGVEPAPCRDCGTETTTRIDGEPYCSGSCWADTPDRTGWQCRGCAKTISVVGEPSQCWDCGVEDWQPAADPLPVDRVDEPVTMAPRKDLLRRGPQTFTVSEHRPTVTYSVWLVEDDWPERLGNEWIDIELGPEVATVLAKQAEARKHVVDVYRARVAVSASLGPAKAAEPAREAEPVAATDGGQRRRCSTYGKPIDDAPYELWLFYTCASCAAEPAPGRWSQPRPTARKWRYEPEWHRHQHPARTPPSKFGPVGLATCGPAGCTRGGP